MYKRIGRGDSYSSKLIRNDTKVIVDDGWSETSQRVHAWYEGTVSRVLCSWTAILAEAREAPVRRLHIVQLRVASQSYVRTMLQG